MLAYYESTNWEATWAHVDARDLLERTWRSPLRAMVLGALPEPKRAGLVLDAGCGPGVWVALLAQCGYEVEGIDESPLAVDVAKRAGATACVGSVGQLPYLDGSVGVYLSLGVIEHETWGPDIILAEAARVLRSGGTALVSVPYENGLRRLLAPYIRWRQERRHRAGQRFYQYIFTEQEIRTHLEAHGFRVVQTTPYGPTKMFRQGIPARAVARLDAGTVTRSGGWLRRLVRSILYTPWGLRACGHMLLVEARR